MKTSSEDIRPYRTRDGSMISELMHPLRHGNTNLSFARAVVEPGCSTLSHVHKTSEEIYHIVRGTGEMTLGRETFSVVQGDTVCIAPNQSHSIKNSGREPLVIFCCCAPAYSHDDTEMCPEME